MADKLMYIPNDNTKISSFVDQNLLKRSNTKPDESTNQSLLKSPKLLSQQIRECYLKLWGLV